MKIGDHVIEKKYGFTGKIIKFHDDFSAIPHCSMSREEWLSEQDIPFTKNNLNEMWVSIECDDGGAIIRPLSDLTVQ